MTTTPPAKPASVISRGRPVMRANPTLSLDAAGLLHTLDELSEDDRVAARAYLLHVYGLTVGITTPATHQLEEWGEAMADVADAAYRARLEGELRALDDDRTPAPR